MSPRTYRMARRGETAEQTRQRIVEATFELHGEKGVAATSVRDIAARADVAVGTVYHHFPTYEEVIAACGAHTVAVTRPPDASLLDPAAPPTRRLAVLAEEFFGFYRRFPGFHRIHAERELFPQLDQFLSAEARSRRDMIRKAVAPRKAGREALAVAFAVLDVGFYRALTGSGLSHSTAVRQAAALLEQALLGGDGARRPQRKEKRPMEAS